MTKKLCIHPLFIIVVVCVEEKKGQTLYSVDVMGPDILITLIHFSPSIEKKHELSCCQTDQSMFKK